ncbi:MAG TPA: hypothetical protein VMN36_17330 [Verrucomicrobiales bacterium]|nr:hypothetical protein [Verrucomicrobiales bacterium]
MKITTTLASVRTPDGALLLLQEHDGEHYLQVDGAPLMSTRAAASEQVMADFACRGLPERPRVLIGGLGFGFTLRRVLELTPLEATVEVAELVPEVVAWNRDFLAEVNGRLLDDPRVSIITGDVLDVIRRQDDGRYNAILLDVDNGPDALVQRANAKLYTTASLKLIKRALSPQGHVVIWSANRDAQFEQRLLRVFAKVDSIAAKAYPKARRFAHSLFVAERG